MRRRPGFAGDVPAAVVPLKIWRIYFRRIFKKILKGRASARPFFIGANSGHVGNDFGHVGNDFGHVGNDFGHVGNDFGHVGNDFLKGKNGLKPAKKRKNQAFLTRPRRKCPKEDGSMGQKLSTVNHAVQPVLILAATGQFRRGIAMVTS